MIVEATNCHRAYAAQGQALDGNFESKVIDFKDMPMGSIQVSWSGIVGTFSDAAFKIYASNLPEVSSFDPDGTEIDGATIIPHAAAGSRIWIRDRLSFRYALIRFTKGSISAGQCDIVALGKKS